MTEAEELELLELEEAEARAAQPAKKASESTLDAIKRNATGFLKGAEQGATFGLADELGAYGQGVLDLALRTQPKVVSDLLGVETRYQEPVSLKRALANYRQARGENREEYKQAEAAAPDAFMGGQLAGGFVMPLPGGATSTLGRTALQGAAMGAATGAGAGEADLTKGEFGQFAGEVAMGAGLGGAFGAGGHLLGKALAKGGGKLRDWAAKRVGKIEDDVAEQAAKEAEAVTLSARSKAGAAAQDAYRQVEHVRDLKRFGTLKPEEAAAYTNLGKELGDKAAEKLLPAAARKAATAEEYAAAVASQDARAAAAAEQKLSTGELKRQTLARLKRYGLPALAGYVGAETLGFDPITGAFLGGGVGHTFRPMMHSLLRLSKQPAVQHRLAKALGGAGAALGASGTGAAKVLPRVRPPLPLPSGADDLHPMFAEESEEQRKARLFAEALRSRGLTR